MSARLYLVSICFIELCLWTLAFAPPDCAVDADDTSFLQLSFRPAWIKQRLDRTVLPLFNSTSATLESPSAARMSSFNSTSAMLHIPTAAWMSSHMLTQPGTLFAVSCIVCLLSLVLMRLHSGSETDSEFALSSAMPLQFFGNLTFSISIVDSYNVSLAIGRSAAFSGEMIGMFAAAHATGSCVIWIVLKVWPDSWLSIHKSVQLFGLLCQVSGVCMLVYLTTLLDGGHAARVTGTQLLSSRFICGFGAGLASMILSVLTQRLVEVADRPTQTVRMMFAGMTGTGAGPLIAALVRYMAGEFFRLQHVHVVNLGLLAALLIWFVLMCPSVTLVQASVSPDCPAALGNAPETTVAFEEQRATVERNIIVAGCLVLGLCRGYMVAALEVASALIFEVDFGWDAQFIGVVICMTFLSVFPLKFFYDSYKQCLCTERWIRFLAWVAFAGSCLLHLNGSMGKGLFLVIADVLIFPSIYLADSLARGIINQNLLPDGSLFDKNNCLLLTMVLTNGVGRYAGPLISRWLIQIGGLQWYSISQMALSMAFIFIFEMCVANRKPSEQPMCAAPGKHI